ncbi:MAG TPA: hypothetical protein VHO29_03595 [Marmoricola sp.]|nr:hypothetical protein [Marmoricola sp.]
MRRTVLSLSAAGMLGAGLLLGPPPAVAADPPPNDDLANNTVLLSAGGTVTGSNVGASAQPGEPNHAGATFDGEPLGAIHSVWWSWAATSTGEATISTCGSAFNTRLAVYTGDSMATLHEEAATLDGNDGSCDSRFAGVTFTATKDTIYRIAVDTEGGLNADGTGEPWGSIQLALTPPPGGEEPPPPDDETNPGMAASEEPYTFTMLRLKPYCKGTKGTSVEDCPRNAENLRFWSAEKKPDWEGRLDSVRRWVEKLQAAGADINLVTVPRPSGVMDGTIMKYLRSQGHGGEVLDQNITPGTKVTTTSEDPVVLKVGYFAPLEDQKILDATLAALEKSAKDRPEVKSKCEFVATDAKEEQIIRKLNERAFESGYLTPQRAGEILKSYGCAYEVDYANAKKVPGITQDAVVGVADFFRYKDPTAGRVDGVRLKIWRPARQDFLLVVREDPEVAGNDILGLGTDGKLTASANQLTRVTVQVVERLTGRLVAGAKVEFYDENGTWVSRTTNEHGEWTFTSRLTLPKGVPHDNFLIQATYTQNGLQMSGFRSIDVVDRQGASFVTMSGRTLTWDGTKYVGTDGDLTRARSLEVVPANLGTGLLGAPVQPPSITQISAAVPAGNGYAVGEHNGVVVADNTNFTVGAAEGLLAIGGGFDSQVHGRRVIASRAWPNPFAAIADALNTIVTGLKKVLDQGASAPGRVEEELTSGDQSKLGNTAQILSDNGASAPSGLISDKGLGVISTGGGNVISTGGGNVISTGGLNLIGQAGGNVISTGGGNVISTGGGN